MVSSFTLTVKNTIKEIPRGKVATYGLLAAYSGNPKAARQVTRILHSSSKRDGLPWHRVVNRNGGISLTPAQGFELQKRMLQSEGVEFDSENTIDLDKYLWHPGSSGLAVNGF